MKKETIEEVAERILFENTKNIEIRYRGGRENVIKAMIEFAEKFNKGVKNIEIL